MQLKIKIKIDDDTTYRTVTPPYDISQSQLLPDLESAVNRALNRLRYDDDDDASEAHATVKHHDDVVGTLTITVK